MYSIEVVCSRKHDCWGSWIRQHKKTLSSVSGKRKKKYHPSGRIDRKRSRGDNFGLEKRSKYEESINETCILNYFTW